MCLLIYFIWYIQSEMRLDQFLAWIETQLNYYIMFSKNAKDSKRVEPSVHINFLKFKSSSESQLYSELLGEPGTQCLHIICFMVHINQYPLWQVDILDILFIAGQIPHIMVPSPRMSDVHHIIHSGMMTATMLMMAAMIFLMKDFSSAICYL